MDAQLVVMDVDGTLTTTRSGDTFRQTANDWTWLPGRVELCQKLREQGVQIALASNQAGVAFPWSRFNEQEMQAELEAVANAIGACYIGVCYTTPNAKALPSYYHPDDRRRKPGPGLILEAMQHCGIPDPQFVVMVGDRSEDESAAQNAGCAFQWASDFFGEK